MIGAMAGEIIGSPYYRHNLEGSSNSFSWALFDENRDLSFRDSRGNKVSGDDLLTMSRKEQKRARVVDRTDAAFAGHFCSGCIEMASYLMNMDSGAEMPDALSDALSVGVACGEYARTADEAIRLATSVVSINQMRSYDLDGAVMCAHAVWMASHGVNLDTIMKTMKDAYGIDTGHTRDEFSMLLKGSVVLNENGKLELGDGVKVDRMEVVIPAVLNCLKEAEGNSDNTIRFEQAVRLTVALGGPTLTTTAFAGAMAEHLFGVSDRIVAAASGYLGEDERNTVSVFEVNSRSTSQRRSDKETLANDFKVIRMGDKSPIYVIPEGRQDIEHAARRACRKTGCDFVMIRPSELQSTMERLSVQRDASGQELGGTYIETVRPEVYKLWLQDGKIRSSSTRKPVGDEQLPSESRRRESLEEFDKLKEFARGVRTELQNAAGYYSGRGNIHFATAFYPEVYSKSIDLMEGDILRGRVRLDDDGRIRVDTNVNTGRSTGEYLQGVLQSMDLFHRNDGPAEIRQKLNEYCLDYGRIEDEDERVALKGGDVEAESVKMKYESNIDRAIRDMSSVSELKEAVYPALTGKELKRISVREERRQESQEKYEGMSKSDVVNPTRHVGSVFTIGHSNLEDAQFLALLKSFGIDTVYDIRSNPSSMFCPHFNGDVLSDTLRESGISYTYSGKEMGGYVQGARDSMLNVYMIEGEGMKPVHVLLSDIDACRRYCTELKAENGLDRVDVTVVACKPEEVTKQSMKEYFADMQEFIRSGNCSPEQEKEIMRSYESVFDRTLSSATFKESLKDVREAVRSGKRVAVMCSEGDPLMCHRFSQVGYALAHPSDGRIKPTDVQHICRNGVLLSQDFLEKKTVKALGLADDPNGVHKAMQSKFVSNMTRTRNELRASVKGNRRKSGQSTYRTKSKGKKL